MNGSRLSAPANPARYVLTNVRVPPALCALPIGNNGWCEGDVLIDGNKITAAAPTGTLDTGDAEKIDADRGILLSGLVDCHTHLDKAHTASFANFPPGDLATAIAAMAENKKTWTEDNLTSRVEFSLRSAYASGVRAMRSHVDFSPEAPGFVWRVMRDAVARWAGRIELQLVPLAGVLQYQDEDIRARIYRAAGEQGILGMFLFDQSDLVAHLIPHFEHANALGWDIDLHVDEGLDPGLDGLNAVAEAALSTGFRGRVLCGHCVALNSYDAERRDQVIARALEAGLHFVSLPVTNLYLQGRDPNGMPQQRGMTPVGYLRKAGATVSLGADNVRDGFCASGDFDPVSVLNIGAQVGHLHEPARDWSDLITRNPAQTMGLAWDGVIAPGAPADLVLFTARTSSEISARGAVPRQVIRSGIWTTEAMPDFRELER